MPVITVCIILLTASIGAGGGVGERVEWNRVHLFIIHKEESLRRKSIIISNEEAGSLKIS